MVDKSKPKIQWSEHWEKRYQYVQKKYDVARTLGIDVLKVFLQVVIALNLIPILFHKNIFLLFGNEIYWIYTSWIYILISVLTGFLAYCFLFEGYYHQAHFEATRWLSLGDKVKENISSYVKQSSFLFDMSHYCGIVMIVSLIFGIVCIIIAIFRLS